MYINALYTNRSSHLPLSLIRSACLPLNVRSVQSLSQLPAEFGSSYATLCTVQPIQTDPVESVLSAQVRLAPYCKGDTIEKYSKVG